MINFDRTARKEIFREIQALYPSGTIICESHLISEQRLAAAAVPSSLTFDISDKGTYFPSYEVRLNRNDDFFISEIGLALSPGNTVGTSNTGKEILDFFPSYDHLTTAADAPIFEPIYKGILNIKVGTDTILEGFSTQELRYSGNTQGVGLSTTDATDPNRISILNMRDALYPLSAKLPIPGDRTINISISFPTLGARTSIASVYLIVRGFLVKNVNILK